MKADSEVDDGSRVETGPSLSALIHPGSTRSSIVVVPDQSAATSYHTPHEGQPTLQTSIRPS